MKKFILTIIFPLLVFTVAKADCTFGSFVVGEDFAIGNMLEWTTTQESDNEMFIVEKSLDGIQYENIGEVASNGNSEEKNIYHFMDLDARKGTAYYRIKQVDFDGEFGFSDIVEVDKETENNFMVASINNPLNSDQVDITVDCIKDLELTYSVKDMKNDILEENTIVANAGLQGILFDLSAYPDGSYKLSLQSGNEEETITIRKTMSSEEAKLPVASKN